MSMIHATPYVPGGARGTLQKGPEKASAGRICVLTQPDLGALHSRPSGIIVVEAAPFSHPMLHLLSRGVPTVLITEEMSGKLAYGEEAFVDGFAGRIIQPAPTDIEARPAPTPPAVGQAIILSDRSELLLRASIFDYRDASLAVNQGAAALGLVRTEFMIPEDGRVPDERFYEETLLDLCSSALPLAVTLRLPDITQDKPVPWLDSTQANDRPLGMQGVRLYSSDPVHRAVNALIKAVNHISEDYSVSLLLPYVTRLDEFSAWRQEIAQILHRVIPIGAMAETPAAVLAMPHWFETADFVAIGCNDLMQCFFGADRDLAEARNYLDAYSPELYRFLQQAASGAGGHLHNVQVCGQLALMPGVLPVLLGIGYRVFSVAPIMIPYLADFVQRIDIAQAQSLARQVCEARTTAEVRALL